MLRFPLARRFSTARRHALPASLNDAISRGVPIDVHPEVQDALAAGKPLVALETTIVTHGMPHPTNLHTAQSVERVVRSTGAIPATIGLIAGRVKVGLESKDLEYLADTKSNPGSVKLSRRDLAAAIALKKDGGTTCSTTLLFAALAGIKVFATGGLGGVHRGGENSMDVSADLQELTRCPVGLVSAGVKSILDIGRSETLGVPVFTYGKSHQFPAFYSPRSEFKSPWRIDDPATAANVLYTQYSLGMQNGVLFGVPIPAQYEAIGERIQEAVQQAVLESEENGMSKRGKEVTPWLLQRVGELTQGSSLKSNIALIENTALVGGQIAVAYAALAVQGGARNESNTHTPGFVPQKTTSATPSVSNIKAPAKLIVVGSAAIDITAQAADVSGTNQNRGLHSTSPGSISLSLGGVGRNIAEAAHRILSSTSPSLQDATALVSSVGSDSFGRLLTEEIGRVGMRTDGLVVNDSARSAVCNMVVDGAGDLIGGVADMGIIRDLNSHQVLEQVKRHSSTLILMDANLSPALLTDVVKYCNDHHIMSEHDCEPTSVIKSTAILPAISASLNSTGTAQSPVTFASPNLLELAELYNGVREEPHDLMSHNVWWQTVDRFSIGTEFRMSLDQLARLSASSDSHANDKDSLGFLVDQGVAQMAVNLLPFFQHLLIKCGALGVLLAMRVPKEVSAKWAQERSNPRRRYIVARGIEETVVLKHFPALALDPDTIVNVTGAGDTLVGAVTAALTQNPIALSDPGVMDETIRSAQAAAVMTLQSPLAVSPLLSHQSISSL
ncbi:indigoidine synthase A-like protein [Amylostereum chailletii]|nr:indigoidine synthase A-like protein [Amylostereum chailletii]